MFVPQTFAVALIMVVISTICWGSWANTFKGTRNYRFELFYWDYAIGIVTIALVLAFTMGSMNSDGTGFLSNIQSADTGNIVSALIGIGIVSSHRQSLHDQSRPASAPRCGLTLDVTALESQTA